MAQRTSPPHSTVDSGYLLTPDVLQNPFTSDPVYQRIIAWHLPPHAFKKVAPLLTKFGEEAISPRVDDWIANAEKQPPYVKQYDAWGRRYPVDRLVTSEGWKQLGAWGAANGVVAHGYESEYGPHRRVVQHAFNYIFSASSAVRSCPVSMTSGAARLLAKHLPSLPTTHPFHEVYNHLISRTDPWVSSQWMTERPGGSDVQNSETIATYSPLPTSPTTSTTNPTPLTQGPYLLSGFKWFCSATDTDIALILGRTHPSAPLSLFLAPTRLTPTTTNGIRIHRLKSKMGTNPLPTSEVQLTNTRAHLVGTEGRGIATIALLLNVTRTHNTFVALSCWRRGLAIAKGFAKARSTLDQPLWTFPMHLRLLSTLELKHRAATHLGFFTTALLSYADNGHPDDAQRRKGGVPLTKPGKQTEVLLRALTATTKGVVCKVGCQALQECQEGLGGVGYLDDADDVEFNVSRLYRDTAANMTWEGTTNVLASEVVRHLCNGMHLEEVGGWFDASIGGVKDGALKEGLAAGWSVLRDRLEVGRKDVGSVLGEARALMFAFAWMVSAVLLCWDAQRDGEELAVECARRWVLEGEGGYGEFVMPEVTHAAKLSGSRRRVQSERERRNWDCRIVWECDLPEDAATGFRPLQAGGKPKL